MNDILNRAMGPAYFAISYNETAAALALELYMCIDIVSYDNRSSSTEQ